MSDRPLSTTASPVPISSEVCPVCGGTEFTDGGIVYHAGSMVAGVPIDLAGMDFRIVHCNSCDFEFKRPAIPAEKLLDCYVRAEKGHWGETVDPWRRNFDRIAGAIRRHAVGRQVLDIGCFNGTFLEYLGPDWQRFGVEPSTDAAELARQRGVEILGPTLDALSAHRQFDVITAIDVVEHIPEPRPFFARVAAALKPGGILVISTGDTRTWSWRVQQARYWYVSYLPEHVSFYSQTTMDTLAVQNGMRSVEHFHMSHDRYPLPERLLQAARGITYGVLMRIGWLGIPSLRRKFQHRAGTVWIAATDHMVHVMRR